VDIRPGSKVAIVADLNEPLPIESESYDGVFSQFLLEHLRLPKLRGFLSELHRILKPGGIAVIITANLLEQAKVLVERESGMTTLFTWFLAAILTILRITIIVVSPPNMPLSCSERLDSTVLPSTSTPWPRRYGAGQQI
jgi:SAM-dependent methyltransferase